MTSLSQASSLTPCESPDATDIPVQPDHFYNANTVKLLSSPGRTWLDPADDPLAQRGIPVFKPTMEEFRDFEGYMNRVECWGMRSGIVKVIPPQEWTDALPSIKAQLADVKIKSPIEQHMFGDRGLFRAQNMEKRKWMSVREWAELCAKEDFRAPSIHEVGLASRHGPVAIKPRATKRTRRKTEPTPADVDASAAEMGSMKAEPMDDHCSLGEGDIVHVPTPPRSEGSPPVASSPATSRKGKGKVKKEDKDEPKSRAKRVHQTRQTREASLADRAARDRAFLEEFDPSTAWLPMDTKPEDYNLAFCQQLERRFWRSLGLGGKPAWYGADTQGSLFTDETTSWNVAHLPSALTRLLPSSDKGLPGVNTPYLYFGMWRATFAWHVEDMDLFSINYIHFGAPKFWYAIPQGRASGLEQAMRNHFPKDTSQCSQFLRHKSFLASPAVLAKDSCKPNCLVQQPGEFVITYPRGYHAGFNLGFNCAESVNFALDSWIEMGRRAKACQCISDSVRIDVDQLIREREEELELERCQDDFATPSLSPPMYDDQDVEAASHSTLRAAPKRKVLESIEMPAAKKVKLLGPPSKPTSDQPSKSHPKISVTLKLGPRPEDTFPCCLCISSSREGLLRVQDPPIGRKDIVEVAGNPSAWMAHEFCASIIPETWVDVRIGPNGSTEKVVYGVDAIVKDRWNLKCSACTRNKNKSHGAPIQCTKGKCPKAFHVSCAKDGLSQGILFSVQREVDKEVVLLNSTTPSVGPHDAACHGSAFDDGALQTQETYKIVKKFEVQVLCTQHNPVLAAQKKADKHDKIRQELLSLPSMSRIKIRVSAGVFEVSLIRVIEETGSVEVLWDQNTRREFKWGCVVFGNTDSPVQHRPSDLATALAHPSTFVSTTSSAPMPSASTSNATPVQMQHTPNVAGPSTQTSGQSNPLTPQFFGSNRISYSQLAGSCGYSQWAFAPSVPFGSAPQAYPYLAYYVPQSHQQPLGQPTSGQGKAGSSEEPAATTSTHPMAKVGLPVAQGVPEGPSGSQACFSPLASFSSFNHPQSTINHSNTTTQVVGAQVPPMLPNAPGSIIDSAQLAEALRTNPQLASMLWAAVGQRQDVNPS